MFYPFSAEIRQASETFDKGNFSLWFNKFTPLNNPSDCCACDGRGDRNGTVSFYKNSYDGFRKNTEIKNMLSRKHENQTLFCDCYDIGDCETLLCTAELEVPLITGLGQTHACEVSMVFDHTMGIPYIPASSVKGIVRLAHTLNLLDCEDSSQFIKGDELNESDKNTMIPDLFGGDVETLSNGKRKVKKQRGRVIFLDAYTQQVPELCVDIMNPHYGDYYGDDNAKVAPADYLEPVPVKFLALKPGSVFVFRALVPRDSGLKEYVTAAYERALIVEGVGAKTAVGYGHFKSVVWEDLAYERELKRREADRLKAEEEQKAAEDAMSPEERDIMAVRDLSTIDSRIGEIFKKIDDFSDKEEIDSKKKIKELILETKEELDKILVEKTN